jgi:hypothetical protein
VISSAFGLLTLRSRVHRTHQLEIGGEGQRTLGLAVGDDLAFQRLAQHFLHAHAELGQFIQEEHAVLRQRGLTGMRPIAAANETSD